MLCKTHASGKTAVKSIYYIMTRCKCYIKYKKILINHYEITFAYFKNITGTVTVRTDNAALYVRQLTHVSIQYVHLKLEEQSKAQVNIMMWVKNKTPVPSWKSKALNCLSFSPHLFPMFTI